MNKIKETDAIGQAIYDYYTLGKSKKLYVLSDISETDQIPVSYLFRDYQTMPLLEKKALQLCRGDILDVGAAAGVHSLFLQSIGLSTFPIDISPLSVWAMQKRGLMQAREIDFFKLSSDKKYDTLLFMMNGVGITGTLQQLPVFFEQCKKLLNPKGQLLLDSSDIIYMFGDDEQGYEIDLNGAYYGEVNYQMKYGKIMSTPFPWLFIDFDTLKQQAETAGFLCKKIHAGQHYDYLAQLTLK
jgi:hypothetical protein